MNHYKIVRSFLLLAFLFSFSLAVNAQSGRDVVYLKNGSVIKGSIMEMIPEGNIKIKTSDGSIFVFKMEEVEKTEKIEAPKFTSQEPTVTVTSNDKSTSGYEGPFIIARVGPILNGLGVFSSDDEAINISGGVITGFQFNKNMSVGIGIETNNYSFTENQNSSIRTYPIFMDARFYIAKKTAQPMFSLQFGYALAGDASVNINNSSGFMYQDFVPQSNKGGAFLAACFGVKIKATNTISLMMDGGFALQSLKGVRNNYNSPDIWTPTTTTVASLRMNFGVAFNLSTPKD